VIGRCQNPWKECRIQEMEEHGVHLARRRSGGGAVYQDLGNTNFTFLSSTANLDKERNSAIIMRALQSTFSLDANTSGRNDIEIDGHKISGAAYKLAPPRALHHGTLLIDVDIGALGRYLNPNKLKLQSKGIASVAARVINLKSLNSEITHETLSASIIQAFCEHYGSPLLEAELLDASDLHKIEELQAVHDEIKDRRWRFGETPAFSHHLEGRFEAPLPWGSIDVHIDSAKGKILQAKVFSDSLYPILIDQLAEVLTGATYDPEGIDGAMAALEATAVGIDATRGEFCEHVKVLGVWLKESL